MLMRAIKNPQNGSLSRIGVKFDSWEHHVGSTQAWPGLGLVQTGMWYGTTPPPALLAEMVEVGTEGEFTLFRQRGEVQPEPSAQAPLPAKSEPDG